MVTVHSIFVRKGCSLPFGIDLNQRPFCQQWILVDKTMADALAVKVRNALWHFILLDDRSSRLGYGRTPDAAINKELALALKQLDDKFNAAEVGSVLVLISCFGFLVASVTIHARHIQQSSPGLADEMALQEIPSAIDAFASDMSG